MHFPKNSETTITRHGTPQFVAKTILSLSDYALNNDPFLKYMATIIKNKPEPLRRVFRLVCLSAKYEEDPKHKQRMRTTSRLRNDKVGNCVDYSIMISALLKHLGIEHWVKIIKLAPNEPFKHVYVVTKNGIILDPIFGKDLNKDEDQIDKYFNKEVPYSNFEIYGS